MTLERHPGLPLPESLAARAEALCAIPSPIGAERALCDAVQAWARPLALQLRRVGNSLVLSLDAGRDLAGGHPGPVAGPGQTARPWVLLCGHLDTIPVPEPDRGRAARREGGRLVATGASDMKGGLAVMLELGDRLPAAERACDLALVLYAREEGPFLENELGDVLRELPALAQADLAICLEPTDNRLQLGCAGSIHASFTFRGRSAHSARPWQGENAVHKAGALLAELGARAPREASSGGLSFREVLSVTRIEGGRARNVVPDECSLNLNLRFAPDRTLEQATEELRALGARHGAEVVFTDLSPAAPAFADRPLVRRLAELTGAPPEPKQAWTDVARLAQAGIPAVNFGPGATAQAHQAGEWLELAALERCYRVLEGLLRR